MFANKHISLHEKSIAFTLNELCLCPGSQKDIMFSCCPCRSRPKAVADPRAIVHGGGDGRQEARSEGDQEVPWRRQQGGGTWARHQEGVPQPCTEYHFRNQGCRYVEMVVFCPSWSFTMGNYLSHGLFVRATIMCSILKGAYLTLNMSSVYNTRPTRSP